MVKAGRLPVLDDRPKTRGECRDMPRPCPYVACRHHLLTNIGEDGRLWINHPDGRTAASALLVALREEPEADGYAVGEDKAADGIVRALMAMEETCSLDVAEREDRLTLEEVADLLGMYKADACWVEQQASEKVRVLVADEHPDDPYFRMAAEQEMKKK